jgi:hypothetical protein
MITQLVAGLIYATYLLVPGFLVLPLIGQTRHRFLLAYAISIVILTGTLAPALFLNYNPAHWLALLHLVILVLALGCLNHRRKYKSSLLVQTPQRNFFSPCRVGILILLGTFSTYHLIVGPYTEIPSDFWKHLARVNNVFLDLNFASAWHLSGAQSLTGQENPVYLAHALIARILDTRPLDLILPATWALGIIFSLGFFFFTYELLDEYSLGRGSRAIGALMSALLTALAFGTATFSYVRYYGYFPAIFSFPLVLASAALFNDYLKQQKQCAPWQWSLIPFFLIAMWVIHRQEAFLTVVLLALIALLCGLRSYIAPSGFEPRALMVTRTSFWVVLILGIAASTIVLLIGEMNPWQNTPHVINAGDYLPFLKGLPMDNPSFRLWDTVGFFGLITYCWALVRWKTIVQSDFLLAGLLMPLVTNLNPFFATIFLHFADATTLWRTAYLIPVGIVTSVLITTAFLGSQKSCSGQKNLVNGVMAILLIAALLPWKQVDYYNRTSRLASLYSVDRTSGAGLWRDLIDAVDSIQHQRLVRRIVTDDVTRFVLYAATRGDIWSWTEREYFPKYRDDYKVDFLESDYSHSLLVVNRRDGVSTENARHAGHWSADILEVSRKYPNDLDEFIVSHPKLFQLLWTSGDIDIFLMHRVGK